MHKSLPRLHFHGYKQVTSLLNFLMQNFFLEIQVTSATSKLRNTGRALVVDIETGEGLEGRLSGGPLPEEYVLLQVFRSV